MDHIFKVKEKKYMNKDTYYDDNSKFLKSGQALRIREGKQIGENKKTTNKIQYKKVISKEEDFFQQTKKEEERLNKEIENLKFEIARSEKMLSNQGFVSKAPANMVENEKNKLEANKQSLSRLEKELLNL